MMTLREHAAAVGIEAATLALILDIAPSSAYRALDGGAGPTAAVRAVIIAWEIMSSDQRAAWLAALDVPAERPRRGRPRKRAVVI